MRTLPHRPSRQLTVIALAAFALVIPASADAKGRRGKTKSYIFSVTDVSAKKGVAAKVTAAVKSRLAVAISKHERIAGAPAKTAPDPVKATARFDKYLKANKLRAFKVNAEVTAFETEVQTDGDRKHVRAHIAVRLFGETWPGRVMAFTGDGMSTIKVEVGKKARVRDFRYAEKEAIDLALAEALATAIKKLDAPPKKKKRRKKKR